MSQGRHALHGCITGPVQGWGMARYQLVKLWSAVPTSSALCGSIPLTASPHGCSAMGGADR